MARILEKMINFALVNLKRAPLCERLTLLTSCEGSSFDTCLHSVANFCNKKLRVEFYSTISRHAKTDESIVLVIWLNERVLVLSGCRKVEARIKREYGWNP